MIDLRQQFEERLAEIDEHLLFLDAVETVAAARGAPGIGDFAISPTQRKVFHASFFLQVYNLVEATANACLDAVAAASVEGGRWKPVQLSERVRREWIRSIAKTHQVLAVEKRVEAALQLYECLLEPHPPIAEWKIERGGGGNWDDVAIDKAAERMECALSIPTDVAKEVKRHVRDDMGALALVKHLRNKLAHGEISFSECGADVTVSDLRLIKLRTENYLRVVVTAFQGFVEGHMFIDEKARPRNGGGT